MQICFMQLQKLLYWRVEIITLGIFLKIIQRFCFKIAYLSGNIIHYSYYKYRHFIGI